MIVSTLNHTKSGIEVKEADEFVVHHFTSAGYTIFSNGRESWLFWNENTNKMVEKNIKDL